MPSSSASAASSSPQPAPAPAADGGSKMMRSIIQRELDRKPSAPPPAGAAAYYVQVASYQDANEAAGVQHRLQGAGFASKIQRADIPGRGTWYRLQVGPYASRDAAGAAQADLGKRLHMQGIVVRGGN
ncbi:MAG TPA: SPOR domain-containing protein, partial [Mariprofundaceae bacterium]|nr:SPOR domain-containing protein [Mariprofundaceae bacterium]